MFTAAFKPLDVLEIYLVLCMENSQCLRVLKDKNEKFVLLINVKRGCVSALNSDAEEM
jgi:hypothetical protein